MASLPCRVCGIDTHVSMGYIGTFVKCLICRNQNKQVTRPKSGPRVDTEEGMCAMIDDLISEINVSKNQCIVGSLDSLNSVGIYKCSSSSESSDSYESDSDNNSNSSK